MSLEQVKGTSRALKPRKSATTSPPPGASKDKTTGYVDIHEAELDEAQMTTWVKQAAALPGWVPGRPS